MNRKLNMGMVGGGKDAFIGALHRIASNLYGHIQLVCSTFNSLIRNLTFSCFYTSKTGIADIGYKATPKTNGTVYLMRF